MKIFIVSNFLLYEKHEDLSNLLRYKINALRPEQNGRQFADDILKQIFFNEN